jgi:hypothetical protein
MRIIIAKAIVATVPLIILAYSPGCDGWGHHRILSHDICAKALYRGRLRRHKRSRHNLSSLSFLSFSLVFSNTPWSLISAHFRPLHWSCRHIILSSLDSAYRGDRILPVRDPLLPLEDEARIPSLTFNISMNCKNWERLAGRTQLYK